LLYQCKYDILKSKLIDKTCIEDQNIFYLYSQYEALYEMDVVYTLQKDREYEIDEFKKIQTKRQYENEKMVKKLTKEREEEEITNMLLEYFVDLKNF
jgi:hypothetical protein